MTETASFDALNRPVSSTDGEGNETITAYDARSQVTSITEPGNHVTAYTYDGLDRPTQEALSPPVVSWTESPVWVGHLAGPLSVTKRCS